MTSGLKYITGRARVVQLSQEMGWGKENRLRELLLLLKFDTQDRCTD